MTESDDKVMGLYDHALSATKKGAKGVLVLDCTDSRVYAEGNVFQKAARVQDFYYSQGQDIFVIVNVGRGAFYRPPGQKSGKRCSNVRKVAEVISAVDSEYGIEIPVFIFGYSRMKRCVSYRSSLRVPTRVVIYMGQGYSIENLVQSLGRATFNGNDLLASNDHSSVTCLMESQDFAVVKKHIAYVQEIQRRLDQGETLDEAMRGSIAMQPNISVIPIARLVSARESMTSGSITRETPLKILLAILIHLTTV
jgi:hypothetical protein